MRLNLGCGDRYVQNWHNVDIASCPHKKDETIDLRGELPWRNVEFAYAGHLLEHLRVGDALVFLDRLRNCMSETGIFMCVGPDVLVAEGMKLSGTLDVTLEELKYGGHRWPGDEHRWECSQLDVRIMMQYTGWRNIQYHPIDEVAKFWPVADSRPRWQFGVSGQK